MDKHLHIAELIVSKQRGQLDVEGQRELDRWLEEDPSHREILKRTSDHEQQLDKLKIYALFDKERVQSQLEEQLFRPKTFRLNSAILLRYAATIVLPLMILGGAAWWFLGKPDADLMGEIDTRIHPGHQQAVLVLSDGTPIELDLSTAMDVMEEGDATISKADQRIHYKTVPGERVKKRMIYNKLITPIGGSYELGLADGSRVWLNAGSSLRFPVSFHDSVRQVFLEGEAYFEVMPGTRPFVVSSGELDTRVLGTSFNVSAYRDDVVYRTTLVEGAVRVTWNEEGRPESQSVVLEADQQASFVTSEERLSVAHVDAGGYVSWVHGKMEFHRESLAQVMKRLSRWYDFEYEFENEAARELSFSARLDRNSQISEILDMLSLTTDVSFEYNGKRIVVR